MRTLGALCTLALSLLLIVATPAYSQDRDDNKPQAQEQPKPQENGRAKNNDKARQDQGMRQDEKARQDQARQDQKNQAREQKDQEKNNRKAQQEQERNAREQDRNQHPADNRPAYNRQPENRPDMRSNNQQHRAAERGRHIPDDQFHSHFGREHRFHVQRERIVNVSQPVVVYGGYSFQLADPWPADWSYDDDCYIDYIDDQYYLFDVMHPGIRVAVFVVE
jgi:hypothetical protein